LECVHEIGYHDRIETFHYFDNETVYFIVRNTAQPTPTDNYASTTQSETAMPEPESYPTLLITEVAFSVAIAFVFVVPTVIYFKKHKPKVEPS
jgi:hypothetical protein